VVTKKHVKNFCLLFFNKLSFLASIQNQKFFIIKDLIKIKLTLTEKAQDMVNTVGFQFMHN